VIGHIFYIAIGLTCGTVLFKGLVEFMWRE